MEKLDIPIWLPRVFYGSSEILQVKVADKKEKHRKYHTLLLALIPSEGATLVLPNIVTTRGCRTREVWWVPKVLNSQFYLN